MNSAHRGRGAPSNTPPNPVILMDARSWTERPVRMEYLEDGFYLVNPSGNYWVGPFPDGIAFRRYCEGVDIFAQDRCVQITRPTQGFHF